MATIKLGINLTGDEITLSGVAISMPVEYVKQLRRVEMSDGSRRWGFYDKFRRWQVSCNGITKAQLDLLITEWERNQALKFQNNYEAATSYDVVMLDFSYECINPNDTTKYYRANFTVEET